MGECNFFKKNVNFSVYTRGCASIRDVLQLETVPLFFDPLVGVPLLETVLQIDTVLLLEHLRYIFN